MYIFACVLGNVHGPDQAFALRGRLVQAGCSLTRLRHILCAMLDAIEVGQSPQPETAPEAHKGEAHVNEIQ